MFDIEWVIEHWCTSCELSVMFCCLFLCLQNCLSVRDLLKSGAFGNCPEEAIKDYEQRCRQLFPLAAALKPPKPPPSESTSTETAEDRGKSEEGSTDTASPNKPLPSHQES